MPLTKQYLRYVHQASFGVVSGRKSNAILAAARKGGGKADQPRIIAPAVEDIIIWDPRKGEKVILNKGKGFYCGRNEACLQIPSIARTTSSMAIRMVQSLIALCSSSDRRSLQALPSLVPSLSAPAFMYCKRHNTYYKQCKNWSGETGNEAKLCLCLWVHGYWCWLY